MKYEFILQEAVKNRDFLNFYAQNATMSMDAAYQLYMTKQDRVYIERHLAVRKVTQRCDGKWRTRVRDQNGKEHQIERTSEADLYDAIINHYKQMENRPVIRRVFTEWADERLKYGEIKRSTYDRAVIDFNRFFVTRKFDEKEIIKVEEEDLTAFIKECIHNEELTKKGWHNLRGLIKGIFSFARQKGYTTLSISSYLGELRLPNAMFAKKVVDDSEQVFSDEEIQQITDWIRSDEKRIRSLTCLGILLTICTGLRAGELSSLKETDFDLENKVLTVQRTEIRSKDEENDEYNFSIQNFTKGRDGYRTIALPDEAIKIFREIKAATTPGEYLFTNPNGERVKGARFSEKLKRICKYIGIPERSLHKLRKTYASILLDSGCPEKFITNQMGHTDVRTTLGHYYFTRKSMPENIRMISTVFDDFSRKKAE